VSHVSASVWLVGGYAAFLVAVAHALDRTARRVARRTQAWRTGTFRYHEDHDAWVCPENQWLWPVSFDPHHRTMRYRGSPTVCNSCPVKSTCTTSTRGREIVREVDPWPHSEAGRFHRGLACSVVLLALLLPLAMLPSRHVPADAVVLTVVVVAVALAGLPLFSHFRNTPSGFPEHVRLEDGGGTADAVRDRFTTRWASFEHKGGTTP
jgi:hypothetical protein